MVQTFIWQVMNVQLMSAFKPERKNEVFNIDIEH